MATTTATTTLQQLINAIGQKAGDKLAGASTEMQSGGGELLSGFLGIDWSAPTWDILILIFFVLSVLVYSFTLGRDRIVAILIATYLALAVTTNLPFLDVATEYINSFGAVAYRLSAFLIVFIIELDNIICFFACCWLLGSCCHCILACWSLLFAIYFVINSFLIFTFAFFSLCFFIFAFYLYLHNVFVVTLVSVIALDTYLCNYLIAAWLEVWSVLI